MTRVLLLILLVWLVYIVIKRAFLDPNSGKAAQKNPKPEEKIVQCSACGTHVPVSDSVTKNDLIVCNNPDCNKN